jgi:acetoin utilization deacetylase AcuC-like enzyme
VYLLIHGFAKSKLNVIVAFHPLYSIQLPEPHRFPMEKYELIYSQLLREGVCTITDFFHPSEIPIHDLIGTHDLEYVNQFIRGELSRKEQRKTGFYHTDELVRRELIIMEGTKNAALKALDHGFAFNIAGGTHHAFRDRGEGFCMLNDQAIAANYLVRNKLVDRIAIIDLDVHQGNGTAAIFNDIQAVFTASMHGKNNYPLHKERSDLDIVLEDGTTDDVYLSTLEKALEVIKEEAQPEFLFYQCGVDVLATDKLGKLSLTKKGCAERDELVFQFSKSNGLPIICTMGGGYSERIADIVDAHINTFKSARDILE